jgi:chromosome segregation protein
MIKSMSRETQFLLVTHSKRMMTAADLIYGVTMQEPGVSKLVSVRLAGEEVTPNRTRDRVQERRLATA